MSESKSPAASGVPPGTNSEGEAPSVVEEDLPPPPPSFPPYPPYAMDPAPPSVADAILAGNDMRRIYKNTPDKLKKPVRPAPRPARPRGPKATDVKLSKRAGRAYARCLRRHGAVLTDRLEFMAKPLKRDIIYLWREYGDVLPADTIRRLRCMLDADEPFKPDQAYEYFVNLRKTKKKKASGYGYSDKVRSGESKRDTLAIVGDKRFVWARNATVALARGIQQRLARPGAYALHDGMLRLSNIVLDEICSKMHVRKPSRRNPHPKAKFMVEMADKLATWIDEILAESEDRMLMMDYDEDGDVLNAEEQDKFTDDFLDMMGGGGGQAPAYTKLTGEMAQAFHTLADAMHQKGSEVLLHHGKFKQTYRQGADTLKKAATFETTGYQPELAGHITKALNTAVAPTTEPKLAPAMRDMVDVASKYLAQNAEFNKDKGPAYHLLENMLKEKAPEILYDNEMAKRTYGQAAKELDAAKGLESYHDDPNLSQAIHAKLTKAMEKSTPSELKQEMAETVDIASKYLSEKAVDESIRRKSGVVTEDGFYVDENGVRKKIGPGETDDDFYIDENGIRLKKKPGEETYVDENGIRRLKKGVTGKPMAGRKTEEGYYMDAQGNKVKIGPGEKESSDFYIDANGNKRKKNPGDETYIDENGIRRLGKKLMAGPKTEEGYCIDSQGNKIQIGPGEKDSDFYIDANGNRKKINPGEETYVDENGVRRLGKPPVAGSKTEAGYYIDAQGNKVKIGPGEKNSDFYIDANGNKKKINPGEETNEDENGVRRLSKPPVAGSKTEAGYYIDAQGNKVKIGPGEKNYDFYIDANGNKKKINPGEETYVDENGVRRLGKPPVAGSKPEAGYYIDTQRNKVKIGSGEKDSDFYIDANGNRKKINLGEETYVDENGVRRLGKKPTAGTKTEAGYYIDAQGNKVKIGPGEKDSDFYIDANGNRRKINSGEETYIDENGVRRLGKKPGGRTDGAGGVGDSDPDRAAALNLLHSELKRKGNAVMYKQPQTELTYGEASKWLQEPRTKEDKIVKDSADTSRLTKKFEKKLGEAVGSKTPVSLQDAMQDVIIESSRALSEKFVAKNYKAMVTDGLISEMQKKGNEILVENDNGPETYFFAAQRLKKAKDLGTTEPCDRVGSFLTKQLNEMIKDRSMARKLIPTMKDHIKEASNYLSENVNKPDPQIEAYVALLNEMETAGDALLIEGNIPKSYKSCAQYLRQLTSPEDKINKPNSSMQSSVESKLKSLMANVPPHGYTDADQNKVISDNAKLLVSYIMLQGERTEALKVVTDRLEEEGEAMLLRHGNIRKSCADGAEVVRGKNADQLGVASADPVVARKLQIKLYNIMQDRTPPNYHHLMEDVIGDTTKYLANYLLKPTLTKVCKCMKSVFVQCELWCDEILRRAARPCCTCSRHVSARALHDLAPAGSRARVSLSQCPSSTGAPCPAPRPAPACPGAAVYSCQRDERHAAPERDTTTTYAVYSASCRRGYWPPAAPSYVMYMSLERRRVLAADPRWLAACSERKAEPCAPSPLPVESHSDEWAECAELYWRMPRSMFSGAAPPALRAHPASSSLTAPQPSISSNSYSASPSYSLSSSDRAILPPRPASSPRCAPPSRAGLVGRSTLPGRRSPPPRPSSAQASSPRPATTFTIPSSSTSTKTNSVSTPSATTSGQDAKSEVVCTAQMSDWHAMMISLMWNVQAWRDWIQENIDRGLAYLPGIYASPAEAQASWGVFQRRVSREAVQWRQYNKFSRQLTVRLALRYKDKQILSPTRSTNKTSIYMSCQEEMLEIISMFNQWTQWLTIVIKETDSLSTTPTARSNISLPELRWMHYKAKVEEYSDDWDKYNKHLKVCWEQKYRTLIAEWLPAWKQPGPVWVVSACGAVPCGAVAAGLYHQEVVWLARTTHRCNVLPGALHPSKHCCIVYADGAVHHYTKYQVMCNAEAVWVPWRAGAVCARAVRVARGVHAGRVLYRGAHLLGAVHAPHYRCHVVIFGRPFAFNCYELLVLADED